MNNRRMAAGKAYPVSLMKRREILRMKQKLCRKIRKKHRELRARFPKMKKK